MAANKLDYSRLLDDEFLNRTPERGRCRGATVSRGAAEVLGLQAALPAGAGPSRLTVFLYGAAMSAAVLISIVFALLLVHAHQEGVQRLQSLGLPFAQRLAMDAAESPGTTTPAPKAGDDRDDSKEYDHDHVHDHAYGHDHEHDGDHDHALHDHAYDHDHEHDGDHDHALQGAADETAHHVALSGGFDAAADEHEHEHAQGIHEHVNSGDVVLEDHHIDPAGDPEPTPHVLLLCLPLPLEAPAEANATNATESTVRLSRAQRDVVHSVAEYLSETARCYLIALRGVEAEGRTYTTTPSAAPGPAPAPSNRTAPQLVGFRTGCGSPGDAGDELDGAEAGGDVVLSTGRKVPVVFWDAATLFAGSPLTAVWRGLRQRRAAGSTSTSTSSAAAAGPDLLRVAGRLQLLWRYGGLSMDLDTSTDRALKALSAYNRNDTAHVYLETTRAVLLAAPQTCNAVVFDLIRAITKQSEAADAQRNRVPDTQEVEHYDVADVKVFDGVLNEYCRGGRRRTRSAAVTPSTTTTEFYTPTAATPPAETPPSTVTSTAAPAPSTRAPPAHARATFNMLRAGPPVPPTTPQPLDIRVDTTHCKGNLVAISLA